MIAHISTPADEPKTVARILAEIMERKVSPFPPGGPKAWMAWSANSDTEIETTARAIRRPLSF